MITFILGKLVLGDPGRAVLGTAASQQSVDAFNANLGLDDPFPVQFAHYFGGLLHGDLGTSYAYPGTPVWSLVWPALQVSASVAILTVIVSVLLSIPLGVLAAQRKRGVVDYLVRGASLVALSIPWAFAGLVLIIVVAVKAEVLPAGGWGTGPMSNLRFLVLPVGTLTINLCPVFVRAVRERAAVVLDEPHVEAALARGVPKVWVVINHVVPNCIGPLLTLIGSNFGALLGGAAIVDVVFGLPGLGKALTSAAATSDLPVMQAVALLAGIFVTLANVFAEIAQRLLDPRLR
ncbi:MAG: ABC transporter permease [Nocardioidaceae bacterium]|nr:ABC transporter permease [Nocardioidaceae bacterium]